MNEESILITRQYLLFFEPQNNRCDSGRLYFCGTYWDIQLQQRFLDYFDGEKYIWRYDDSMKFRSLQTRN